LSRSSNVIRLETIDADKSIIRFNLDDIGWHPLDWDLVLANDPGYFWTSYDFGGNRDRQSLYEFPLGPGGPHGFSAAFSP
jgi:hypothetical protein